MTTSSISTSTSGVISSTGIGSGLDVDKIISSLMAVEGKPLALLQNKASAITTEISAVGQIQSLTTTLGSKAQALDSAALWKRTTSSSADSSVVTSDTSSGNAVAGTYSVTVQQLAQGQTVTSNAQPTSTSTLGTGTLTIQLGAFTMNNASPPAPTAFTAKSGSPPLAITIGAGDTSLSAIRDKINAANAGVTASIITDSTGARLSLRSTATGAENGFTMTATEAVDDGNATSGLSALDYDPLGAGAQLHLNQGAVNAKATVNGVAVESASNTLSNISDGLSITLAKKSDAAVDVTVGVDTASMQTAINDFVGAYNALNAYIHTATKYDAATGVAAGTARTDGPLQGDPSIIGFQNQMRSILNTTSSTSSRYARLSDIGVAIQADGSLSTSSTKLSAALAHPDELSKLFTTQGTGNANTGVMVRFASLSDKSLATDGALFSRAAGLKSELMRNGDQQTEMQSHLDATQTRLTAQYRSLDTTMARMSALSSYVTQQIALMQK